MSVIAPNSHRILIVEDEAAIAMEIEIRLTRMGYSTIGPTATGEKALLLAESNRPHLALMDINLAGDLDGIETASRLRGRHDIPSVFLTAYSDDLTIQRASGSGPLGYLTKPFSDRDLHAAIEVALYKHKTDRELQVYREQLERTVAELRTAISEVKTLQALLPVCASCKRIRDDQGYWSAVDTYVVSQGLGAVTHGICPECIRKLYPNLASRKPPERQPEG
jgi:CheY-like chemotaxis protein